MHRFPPELVAMSLDKAVQVPHFACLNLWRIVHRDVFLNTPRYKEIARFTSRPDAAFWLLWRIADSFALSVTGNYCEYSQHHSLSPLPSHDTARAFANFQRNQPSRPLRALALPLISAATKKLRAVGPAAWHVHNPLTPPLMPLSSVIDLKRCARGVSLLGDDAAQPPISQHLPVARRPRPQARAQRTARSRPTRPSIPRGPRTTRIARSPAPVAGGHMNISVPPSLSHDACHTEDPPAQHTPAPNPNPIPPTRVPASTLVALTAPGPTPPATSRPVFSCGLKQTRAKLGVPDVWVVFKHKFREDVLGAKRKLREILRHNANPMRPVAQKVSRCLTLIWKFATDLDDAKEILSMQDLRHFVTRLRAHPDPHAVWGELDIEEMFPNIPKSTIPRSIEFLWGQLCKSKGMTSGELCFAIHRAGLRQLDHLARRGKNNAYIFLGIQDVFNFVQWDLTFNTGMTHFSSIWEQCLGCPIGGSCSAQYASLSLCHLEKTVPWNTLPPILRYRDNYLLYITSAAMLTRSPQQCMQFVIDTISPHIKMMLTREACGKSIPFLEAQLQFTDGYPSLAIKAPVFQSIPGDSTPTSLVRMLDYFSPNAPSMLRSFVPNALKKCQWYSFSNIQFTKNVSQLVSVLYKKQYPHVWWRPLLLASAAKVDLEPECRTGLIIGLGATAPQI